jgi:hypothetical protein
MPVYTGIPLNVIIGAPTGITVQPTNPNVVTVPQPTIPKGGTSGQVLAKASNSDYILTWVNNGSGGTTGRSGTATFTGDGVILQFAIPHGLGVVPGSFNLIPQSTDAIGLTKGTLPDATYLYADYGIAPPVDGSGNVVIAWQADI